MPNPINRLAGLLRQHREARCPWQPYNVPRGETWRFGVRRVCGDRVLVEHETGTLPADAPVMDVMLLIEANTQFAADLEDDRQDRRRYPEIYANLDVD